MSARTRIVLAVPPEVRETVFPREVLGRLEDLGDVEVLARADDWSVRENRAALQTAEVIVTGWRTARLGPEELALAQRLRAVVHSAGTVKFLIDPVAYSRGVRVTSQAATNAQPVAEYTLGAILLALKDAWRVSHHYRTTRAKVDRRVVMPAAGIRDKRVGLVGASAIGRIVIDLLRPFDVEVAVYDPFLGPGEAEELGVTLVKDLGELMASSDLVSLHAPLLPSTRGMITKGLLGQLRDGATLVNTARGALIDQDALVVELASGRINAVIDVTHPEVSPPDSALWELPNVFLTPHIAGTVGTELPRLGHGAVDEVERFLGGAPFQYEITEEAFAGLA